MNTYFNLCFPYHLERLNKLQFCCVQLDDSVSEEKTDTDKNMAVMFNILRKNRRVRLENLILNRISFSQTVENLFALSFLVKDGRAEIKVDEKDCHFVCKFSFEMFHTRPFQFHLFSTNLLI